MCTRLPGLCAPALSLCSCSAEEEAAPDGAVAEYRREKQKYEALRKQQPKKGTSREDEVTSELKSMCSSVLVSVLFPSCVSRKALRRKMYGAECRDLGHSWGSKF